MFFAVCFGVWENSFYSGCPFLGVDCVLNFDYVAGFAEAFNCAVFAFALDFYAVINHAI